MILFSNLEAAKLAQEQHGGRISILRKFNEIEHIIECDLDGESYKQSCGFEPVGNEMLFLNVTDQAKLKNGFRYIKELLQYHNYKMDSDYRK